MITRIEIDGFKSFQNFAMDLQPFQVIIGQNGVGKSNLFDALMILSRLANGDKLFEAFQGSRGSVEEQFSLLADRTRSKSMKFAVELLLPKKVQASLNEEEWIDIPNTRYRYEIQLTRHENPAKGLFVGDEILIPISPIKDSWLTTHSKRQWAIQQSDRPYFSNAHDDTILISEAPSGSRFLYKRITSQESILSRAVVRSPIISAIADSMIEWQTLAPNPVYLREPYDLLYPANYLEESGVNFVGLLYRLKQADEFALNDIARDMMNLNQNIKAIDVRLDEVRRDIYFLVQDLDGNWLSPKLLSDGTLRTLAYVTLRYLPEQNGVFCIEEPENSVHPLILEKVVKLFQSMTTDFSDTASPLRQIILNTHSPALLSYVPPENIAYLYMPRHSPRITAVGTVGEEGAKGLFTKAQIKAFLEAASPKGNLMENLG